MFGGISVAAAVTAAVTAAIALITVLDMKIDDMTYAAPGSLTGGYTATVDPKNAVKSRDLTSFTYVSGVETIGMMGAAAAVVPVPGALPVGRYELYLGPDDDGGLICRAKFGVYVSVEFSPDRSALRELADLLAEIGAADANGYYASNSALGSYLDVKGDYASGEHLSIHAEGGASVGPGIDFSKVHSFFNDLAEKNGVRFVTPYTKDELISAFYEWIKKNVPNADERLEDIKVEYTGYDYGANITMMVYDKESTWKWVASVSNVSFITGRGNYARYLALGYNDDSEVLVGEIDLFPDD